MNHLFKALIVVGIGVFAQGCVVHSHGARRVVTEETVYVDDGYVSAYDYRYSGYHPIPHAHGGGWCNLTHLHVHGYEPGIGYSYYDNYYVYSRPRHIYYYGGHYDPHGAFCNHSGRHHHDYVPSTHAASAYNWDSRRNSYVYTPSRDRAVRSSPRAAPPTGRGTSAPGYSSRRDEPVRSSPSVAPPARGNDSGSVRTPRSSPAARSIGPAVSDSPRSSPAARSAPTGTSRSIERPAPERVRSAPPARSAPVSSPRSEPTRSAPVRSAPSMERSAPSSGSRVSAPSSRSAPSRSAPARSAPRGSSRTR